MGRESSKVQASRRDGRFGSRTGLRYGRVYRAVQTCSVRSGQLNHCAKLYNGFKNADVWILTLIIYLLRLTALELPWRQYFA